MLGSWGGDDGTMSVEDVGMGVGYFRFSGSSWEGDTRARRLAGRGRHGEDENGSNAGSNEGAGRFTPATGDTGNRILLGEELMAVECRYP